MAKQTSQKSVEGAQVVRYFGPLLDALRGLGGSGTPDEVVERIASDLKLSDEVQNELLPSGEPRYRNQVHWARFYLVREGLLDSSRRGVWSLTERGRSTTLTYQQAHQIFLKWVPCTGRWTWASGWPRRSRRQRNRHEKGDSIVIPGCRMLSRPQQPRDLVIRRALLPRFPYAVVFMDLGAEIRVLAAAHARRRPGYWLNRVET